jgi:uncharacterized repeat protein (TIGR04042 family)
MHFVVRWPDDTRMTCYSPSLVIGDHLAPATAYLLPDFLARVRIALRIASERVEAKYGMPCVRAIDQLARIEATAAIFAGEPAPTVTVESFAE